jgi:hypothetical protein
MESNPYATPTANPYGTSAALSSESASPGMIAALAGTKPWVWFMSIIMWIGAGFMILYAVFAVFAGIAMASTGPKETAAMSGMILGFAVFYGLMSVFMVYPAVKLWSYGARIGAAMSSHAVADVEAALHEQRRYWKFQGIMIITMFCLMIIGVIVAVVMMASLMPMLQELQKSGGMH